MSNIRNLMELYSSKPSDKSLESYKQKLLNRKTSLNPIFKQTEKPENWVGYSSSSPSERLDSESENEEKSENYVEKLSKGIVIDENTRKVKSKEYKSSEDIKWLGIKPTHIESHSLAPIDNPKTIYRDSKGVIIDENAEKKKNPNEERLKKWAGGEVQIAARKQMEDMIEKEKTLPFARHDIDDEFKLELKKRTRFGDPLANFAIEDSVKKQKFMWENRFNIAPGKMWDGVDRTNGFEERWLAKQGRKVWENSVAYKTFASEL
ncbi:hypothetical protein SteCoe_11287 [Stentor coeruleus]|uniref:Pre-mRNA-splicing factor CWC26 n=1 Tax=Stentor coeruleus TaxID=5963 RepID=A0A1R2CDK3_9CILI|nr:hypothetical protein SteCoe_11287 [Stentor coeruleus]